MNFMVTDRSLQVSLGRTGTVSCYVKDDSREWSENLKNHPSVSHGYYSLDLYVRCSPRATASRVFKYLNAFYISGTRDNDVGDPENLEASLCLNGYRR
jgi:hypothetical protein